jgi:hypothetical protein
MKLQIYCRGKKELLYPSSCNSVAWNPSANTEGRGENGTIGGIIAKISQKSDSKTECEISLMAEKF